MYRRTMLATVGAAVLALATLAGSGTGADEKKDAHAEHMHGEFAKCARACADCMLECESCASHCARLVAKGEKKHFRTLATCADCGDTCALAAKVVSRQGPMAVTICEACARTCDICGKACAETGPDDAHMQRCAKACRACAKACREMIKHAGHEHSKGKES